MIHWFVFYVSMATTLNLPLMSAINAQLLQVVNYATIQMSVYSAKVAFI